MKVIETKRLTLIGCDKQILEAAIEGNGQLGKLLLVTVPDNWTEFGIGAFQYSLEPSLRPISAVSGLCLRKLPRIPFLTPLYLNLTGKYITVFDETA